MANDKEPTGAKITLTQSVDDLIQNGPTMKVGIAALPFDPAMMSVVLAQIDTGAHGTAVSPRIANSLGLKEIDRGEVHEAGRDPIVASYYRVRLRMPGTDIEIDVVGLPTLREPHDVLIGRDVLANCRLAIDFANGKTWLHIKSSPS